MNIVNPIHFPGIMVGVEVLRGLRGNIEPLSSLIILVNHRFEVIDGLRVVFSDRVILNLAWLDK